VNTPIKQCCKDWIEVIDKQGNLIEQLEEEVQELTNQLIAMHKGELHD
jgi:hypothetical protein